jgi:titin
VKVSSLPQDDLLVLDPTTRQLHVLVGDPAQVQAGRVQAGAPALPLMTALETAGAPLAVLPMRLNRDALDDLVLLQTGQGAPSVLLTVPVNTFTVGNTNDSGPFSLRQAILDANASPGADAIDFQYLPSGTLEFNVLSDLPRITEALIIDGTTYEGGAIRLKTMASFLGLQLGGGSNVVRGLEFRGFPFPIVVVSAGNLVEGNKIVPPASGEFPLGFGMRIPNAVNNTIGGTVAAARNEIDGNLGLSTGTAITITGGSASGNKVQGNLIRRAAYAVVLSNAPGNLVGGTLAGARNVIIESDREGLRVIGGFAAGNLVQGNFIGLDAAGTAALGNGQNGIVVAGAPATTVGGTVAGARNLISANGHGGIWITAGASETLVQGNFIGTDVTGTLDRGNAFAGVTLSAGPGPGTVIGGNVAGARNVIAGNGQDGVQLSGATGTLIQGNFIGTNAAGTAALGNTLAGVLVDNAAATQIGGTATGAGNVIAGNLQGGVRVIGSGAAGAVLQGNRIGTNAAGTAALANGGDAVLVRDAPNALIGGTAGGAANLLSGNAGAGISLENAGAIGATVQGNRIGTNAAGTAALPNAGGGVLVIAPNALIGGTATGARNLISGNTGHGVSVNTAGAGARVQGNYIGTDVTGTLDLGNTQNGVDVATTSPVPGVVIGGTASLARNLIAGNNGHGIRLAGAGVTGAQVLGNFIGTTATGTAARPNTGHGVLVDVGASGNTIGGAAAGATNTIAFNGGDGVFVNSGIGNQLRRNAIFANAGLGIDLAPNGVTPNDPGDADAGVNNLQNFPVLTAVTSTATTTTITGSLNSAASSGFTIEFFRSLTCDGPANGEGRVFLRDVAVTTNASGTAGFNVTVTPAVPAGQTVTATATRTATRDTSEFSACRAAPLAGPSGKPPRGGGLPSILAE